MPKETLIVGGQIRKERKMDELISRHDVIDAIQKALDREACLYRFVRKVAIDAIKTMPSTQPERKKGRWYLEHHVWFCDQCGKNPTKGMGYVQGTDELFDFCPNCGADMRGDKDEV